MKKIMKLFLLLLISVSMVLQPITKTVKVSASEPGKSITILFTHDMHDNLLPAKALQDGKEINLGGYARLQSAINEQKAAEPQALLVDAGDFSMGTPFQTIYQSDAPELRMLGAMGYDVTTFGNHEYDYRPAGLSGSLRAALSSGEKLPQIVQSNVTFPTDKDGKMSDDVADLKKAMDEYGVKDYTVLERNGVKIGVFGLMGAEAASFAPKSGVVFTDEIKEAKRVVKILKEQEKVDMILCLSHSGTNADKSKSEDEILAKEVPDIDVIISGHTHTILNQPIIVGQTVIGSCGCNGENLGIIQMMQGNDGSWQLGNYKLEQISDSFTEDSVIAAKVADFKNLVQEKYFDNFGIKYDDIIAQSEIQFQTPEQIYATHADSTIGNLISDAYIYAVKQAEGDSYVPITAAVVPCGTIRGTIFPGEITIADAFNISSLGIGADGMPGYPLISVYLTGKELKTLCEVDASIAPIMGDAQLYLSGLNYTFNPHRLIFNKVTKAAIMNEDGSEQKIDDKKLYRIVAGLYSAQMLSVVGDKSFGLMSLVPKDKDGKPITNFEDYIIYEKQDGSSRELKEWYAIAQYLQSFERNDGVPQVPEYYKETHGRKVVDNNKNIIALVKNPNGIALTVYIAVPVVIVLITFLIVKLIKRIKRKRAKRREKKLQEKG